jgi:CRP/FNR family transcriptional regulator, cyclic AMP receptor protein
VAEAADPALDAKEEPRRLLASSELFSSLPEEALRSVAAEAHPRRFRKGSRLFHEGDPGDEFFVIAEGTVKIVVSSPDGAGMILATLRPPDALGEVSLLDGGPRSASAEALDDVLVLAFARSTLLTLIKEERSVADAMLHASGRLLRRLTGQAADLVFLDLEGRIAKLLVAMADDRGVSGERGLSLDLGVTQADLASMVGGSRQSVNQILRGLAGRGLVELGKREITIVEEDALRRRAGM